MAILFSNIAFFGLIVTAVSGIVWAIGQFRKRDTKARSVCIVAAVLTVFGIVGFGITHEPGEKPQDPPPAAGTEASSQEPAEGDTQQPTEPPLAITPPVTTTEPENPPQGTTGPTETPIQEQNPLFQLSVKTKPVMNGFKTEQIGTWAYIETTKSIMQEVTDQQLKDYMTELDKEKYNWFNIFFEDGTGLYFMSGLGGSYAEYGTVDKNEGGSIQHGDIYTFEDGAYKQTGGFVDIEAINKALVDSIPKKYQDTSSFFAECSESRKDGKTISVSVQIDLGKEDTQAAKDLAIECYEIAKQTAEDFDCNLESFNIMVVNKGAPVGVIATQDGTNYTIMSRGKQSNFTVSD